MFQQMFKSFKKKDDQFLPPSFIKSDKTDIHPVLSLDSIIRGMSQGTVLFKITGPTAWKKRKFKVDVPNMTFFYYPTDKPFWKDNDSKTSIADIIDIRTGWCSDVFYDVKSKFRDSKWRAKLHPQMNSLLTESNCFSVVITSLKRKERKKVLDLVAPNQHTRDAWVKGLNHLVATCRSSEQKILYERWLKDQVRMADVSNNGSLNFKECLILLKQLNISMDRNTVQSLFDKANFNKLKIDGEDALDPEEFVVFYRSLTSRPELEIIMKKYSVSQTALLGPEELQQFFLKDQKQPTVTIADCIIMIAKYEPDDSRESVKGFMTVTGFNSMLLSEDHEIFNVKHRLVYQDMSHPLNHYYIASSHNTYLVGDQLVGASSVEGYIQALLMGCRCLELDIWDGGDGEPIIYHGYTLTSRIYFKDVLSCIKDYAFRVSEYPVILSLENHCSLDFQAKMADYFVSILGDLLYTEPVGIDETEFPSPEALANKIILKGKKLRDSAIAFAQEMMDDDDDDDDDEDEDDIGPSALHSGKDENAQKKDLNFFASYAAPKLKKAPNLGLDINFSNLINYCATKKFRVFDNCASWKFNEMASFQETKAERLEAEEGWKFVKFNKVHLARIYPKGSRADSSNYDPMSHWNVGCQLVALNYQTKDEFTFLNNAKFAQNGNCGYILKPRFLWDNTINYFPNEQPDPFYKKHMLIWVISGQQIPKPVGAALSNIVDPYVIIKVFGHPMDVQKSKTHYVSNNGFNPHWDKKFLINLHMPELAMILFTVKDNSTTGKNETLGKYAIPFTSIKQGYRHIHLLDEKGLPLVPASLFVHISIGDY